MQLQCKFWQHKSDRAFPYFKLFCSVHSKCSPNCCLLPLRASSWQGLPTPLLPFTYLVEFNPGDSSLHPRAYCSFFFYYIRIVFLFLGVMKIIWTLNFNVCKTKQNHIGTLQCIAICFHIICGCFHARAVELSICNENQMACKVQVTITWLLIEKGHWPLLWCSDHSGRLIIFFQGCDLSFYSLCFLSMQTASSF